MAIFSIGHSNRTLDEFINLLLEAEVSMVADVRLRPASRRFPYFSRRKLSPALASRGIQYRWFGEALGGMRAVQPHSAHEALREEGLRGYADHMNSSAFASAVNRIAELADEQHVAMLCAEKDPLHCHRSLIADWLGVRGIKVSHLGTAAAPHDHQRRPEARLDGEKLIYDRGVQAQLL